MLSPLMSTTIRSPRLAINEGASSRSCFMASSNITIRPSTTAGAPLLRTCPIVIRISVKPSSITGSMTLTAWKNAAIAATIAATPAAPIADKVPKRTDKAATAAPTPSAARPNASIDFSRPANVLARMPNPNAEPSIMVIAPARVKRPAPIAGSLRVEKALIGITSILSASANASIPLAVPATLLLPMIDKLAVIPPIRSPMDINPC